MRVLLFAFLLVAGWELLTVSPAGAKAPARLRVSDNRRFLTTEQGQPFFYLGDTAWELFHRLNREAAETYLRDRAAKGFTVIQAVVLAELDGLKAPNPYGQIPLIDNDPRRPNEKYFEHVDWIVDKANELGLVIGMLPTWGDKWNKKWGVGPEIFDPTKAQHYGKWLGERNKNRSIIWILGGDRPVENDRHRDIVRALAKGLRQGDGGRHLITFHPTGGSGSAEAFHAEPWLDFNMRQNGHSIEFTGRYDKTRHDYDRTPTKPILDGEPVYEDHPVAFKPIELGCTTAADVRRAFYWDVFSGACGHTYGHHSVWQMFDATRPPVNHPLMPWREALAAPGAEQMQYGRRLIESRPYFDRIPDETIIVPSQVPHAIPGAGTRRFVATRDQQGTYAMVYAPIGRPFQVRLGVIHGPRVRAWWYDPRTGKATLIGEFANTGDRTFTPPNPGELIDWVLVLDDTAKDYPPPGTVR